MKKPIAYLFLGVFYSFLGVLFFSSTAFADVPTFPAVGSFSDSNYCVLQGTNGNFYST
jgi:hypothetical protein